MKQKSKLIIAVSILLVVISLIIGLIIMSAKKISNIELPTYLATITPEKSIKVEETPVIPISQTTEEAMLTNEPTPTSESTPTTKPTSTPYVNPENSQAIAKITIETGRKTRTYYIMPDVDEQTLKDNIGHLPSSSLPGQIGTCVLMGHRDTDFSILKYSKSGDRILVKYQDVVYTYVVIYTQIIQSNDCLKFEVLDSDCLVLVTCYPFRYNGYAPKKFIVTCKLLSKL